VQVAIVVANMGPTNMTAGSISINLLEAGFSTETRAAITDVFSAKSLGWHTGVFVCPKNVNSHGVLLLRLSYSPQYDVMSGGDRDL
jgi:hypothetical protein